MDIKLNNALIDIVLEGSILGTSMWRASAIGGIRVFKGTIPTKVDLNTSSVSTNSYRSSDILIESKLVGNGPVTNNIWDINYIYTPGIYGVATASGVASWFIFSLFTSTTVANIPCAVGTISGVGGGGDLIVDNVNIVSGLTYYFKQWIVQFPKEWTV